MKTLKLNHELAQLEDKLPAMRNYNVLVREWQDEIIFLHKIASGSADKSYGIHVARLAGVPAEILDRAKEVLAELETHPVDTKPRPAAGRQRRRSPTVQPSLFADLEVSETARNPEGTDA